MRRVARRRALLCLYRRGLGLTRVPPPAGRSVLGSGTVGSTASALSLPETLLPRAECLPSSDVTPSFWRPADGLADPPRVGLTKPTLVEGRFRHLGEVPAYGAPVYRLVQQPYAEPPFRPDGTPTCRGYFARSTHRCVVKRSMAVVVKAADRSLLRRNSPHMCRP